MNVLRKWLKTKWSSTSGDLVNSYRATFSTAHGQQVLNHLIDNIYCQVYEGSDVVALAMHNGRRSVVHEILLNIDAGENPSKYMMEVIGHGTE